MREVVCKKEDIDPGKMRSASLGKVPIVICRTKDGEFYAYANRCLHQGAPLSEGALCGDTKRTDVHGNYEYIRDGEILRCPWHGLEYDIKMTVVCWLNRKRNYAVSTLRLRMTMWLYTNESARGCVR